MRTKWGHDIRLAKMMLKILPCWRLAVFSLPSIALLHCPRIICSLLRGAEAEQAPWSRLAFQFCTVRKDLESKPPHSRESVYWLICACGEDLMRIFADSHCAKAKNEEEQHNTIAYKSDKVARSKWKSGEKSDTNRSECVSHVFPVRVPNCPKPLTWYHQHVHALKMKVWRVSFPYKGRMHTVNAHILICAVTSISGTSEGLMIVVGALKPAQINETSLNEKAEPYPNLNHISNYSVTVWLARCHCWEMIHKVLQEVI